ncbi:Ecdysteroid kinase-like family [Popillia japonica]|uniref:Ecdysteroid kinase-like family n=1 Tax=Popillia japonica TaxID=7064 RepID=A0AAW1KLS1_POPJA
MFDSFLQEKIGKSLNLTPTCHYASVTEPKEYLIFEHLKVQNFSVFDKKRLLDEDHILVVLRNYAKLHGVSYALKDQRPDVFREVPRIIGERTVWCYKTLTAQASVSSSERTVMDYNRGRIDETTLKRFEEVGSRFYEFLEEIAAYDDRHKVMVHGDSWLTNMQFKYDDL